MYCSGRGDSDTRHKKRRTALCAAAVGGASGLSGLSRARRPRHRPWLMTAVDFCWWMMDALILQRTPVCSVRPLHLLYKVTSFGMSMSVDLLLWLKYLNNYQKDRHDMRIKVFMSSANWTVIVVSLLTSSSLLNRVTILIYIYVVSDIDTIPISSSCTFCLALISKR